MTTQEDIQRIYNLIRTSDKSRAKDHLEVCERLTAVETKLTAVPPQRDRPCEFFEDHIKDHKEKAKAWYNGIVVSVFKLAVAALIGGYIMVKTKLLG